MRPDGVVVVFPDRQRLAGMGERGEQGLVQQFVAEAAVEALDEGILLRLARRDVVPFDRCSCDQRRIAMLVSSVPLSETHMAGRPRAAMRASSSRTTRSPAARCRRTSARHSRVKSSTIAKMRNRRPSVKTSDRSPCSSAGWALAGSSSGPACPAPACARHAGAPAAAPRDRAGGASCGSCGALAREQNMQPPVSEPTAAARPTPAGVPGPQHRQAAGCGSGPRRDPLRSLNTPAARSPPSGSRRVPHMGPWAVARVLW